MTSQIWKFYLVRLQFEGPFAAAIPKDPKEIRAILNGRLPAQSPPDAAPADESAEPVTVDAGTDEKALPAWSTFKRDEKGLYYEGRCVRGHLKDCARQVAWMCPNVSDFKATVSNATYVMTDKIYLGKEDIEDTETRFIRMGPQPAYRYVDYVVDPALTFTLKLLNNGVIREEHLRAIFEYGGTHGMGQERSQGWGRYQLVNLSDLNPQVEAVREAETPARWARRWTEGVSGP